MLTSYPPPVRVREFTLYLTWCGLMSYVNRRGIRGVTGVGAIVVFCMGLLGVAAGAEDEGRPSAKRGGRAGISREAIEKGIAGTKGLTASGGNGLSLYRQIDPARYVLGPGDELAINLWGEYNSFETQVVSATGKITLPTIGELKVSGLHLDQAEALLRRSVEKFYRKVSSGISLTRLRRFKVGVLGAVRTPGNYDATLDTRVSDLLVEAGGILPGGSLRRIQVKQRGKIRVGADLNAYLRRGVEEANPFLQEGDAVFVPPVSGSIIRVFDHAALNSVPIETSFPSDEGLLLEYELEEGQSFSSLVYDLGGLNPMWDFSNVYVVRKKPVGAGTVKFKVDISGIFLEKDLSKDLVLQKGDDVFFSAQPRLPYLNGNGEIVGIETPYYGPRANERDN